MEQHQDVVLQQRVRARPVVDTRRPRGERVGRPETEDEKENQHDADDSDRPGNQFIVETPAVTPGDECRRQGERKDPQENRTFERAPHRGEVVESRGRA